MKTIKTIATVQNRDSKFYYATIQDGTQIKLKVKNVEFICGKVEAGQELPVIGQRNFYLQDQLWWSPNFARIMESRKEIIENQNVEFKSSLLHTSFSCDAEEEPRLQMLELVKTMLGGWNSGSELTIWVGYDDKTRAVKGIDDELKVIHNQAEFIARLRNLTSQVTQGSFFLKPQIEFTKKDNKTLLKIFVPENARNEIVLMKGNQLYVRLGASTHMLRDSAMVQFISDRATNRMSN